MNLTVSLCQPARRRRHLGRAWAFGLAAILALVPGLGCTREFFREWADQDVAEAVFEKTRDPRWRMEMFTIEPPSLSRFADPYDPDRPPAPPDDRAAEALSPVPQWPVHRLLTPAEGTGYNDMLEQGPRYEPEEAKKPEPGIPTATPRVTPAPARTPSPFQQPTPNSGPGAGEMTPNSDTAPANPPDTQPTPAPGAGSTPPQSFRSPKQDTGVRQVALASPDDKTNTRVRGTPSRTNPQLAVAQPAQEKRLASPKSVNLRAPADPRIQLASTATRPAQKGATSAPAPAQTSSTPAAKPLTIAERFSPESRFKGLDTFVRRTAIQANEARPPQRPAGASDDQPQPRADLPGMEQPKVPEDPQPNEGVDAVTKPVDPRSGMSDEQYKASGAATANLAGILSPGAATFDETEAAGLPPGSRPYIVDPAAALNLALINNRPYQFNIEAIYIQALTVTLQRFAFQPQFYAGMSPQTGPVNSGINPNFVNSFLYRTNNAPGGQSSVLSLGTAAGFGKAFSSGAKLVAGIASQIVFNFGGKNGRQPTVQSVMPLSLTQNFLSGGGRAVTLEPLTLAERQLLYQIRIFARIRQEFIGYILTQNNPLDQNGNTVFEPNIGYLQVIRLIQSVENSRKTVASFERIDEGFREMAKGGGSGVSQLNVDQVYQQVLNNRQSLLTAVLAYRLALDQYRVQLGLPPDVPIILDRSLMDGFREVFDEIDVWFMREDRQPEELPDYVKKLPALEEVFLDGRPVVAMGTDSNKLEDVLLAAERIALENRFDLMNARGALYDAWRNLAVTANGLLGVFNLSLTNQYLTPTATTNPFGFIDQSKQFNLIMQAELPLVRVAQRNAFRNAQITYRRQQRVLQDLEDSIKFSVRSDIRNLIVQANSYNIQKDLLVVNLRQKDNAQRQIFAPPGAGDTGGSTQVTSNTLTLVGAQNSILGAQNALIGFWVSYQQFRIGLYDDLGIMPYDEWEAYYELFPQKPPAKRPKPNGAGGGTPPAQPAPAQPLARR